MDSHFFTVNVGCQKKQQKKVPIQALVKHFFCLFVVRDTGSILFVLTVLVIRSHVEDTLPSSRLC